MHDVIRDYLQEEAAGPRLAQLHGALVDAGAAGLPAVPAAGSEGGTVTAWWELPEQARYLREHLIEHLLAAGRPGEAEVVAADLRWAGMRLQASGPVAPYADLAVIGTPRAERLARLLGQAAHLLAPTDPLHSLTDILYSRAACDPDWGPQARLLAPGRRLPALANLWLPPDLTRPALRRVLTGHAWAISAIAIAPDGTWLAAADVTGRVLTWDAATGKQRAVIPADRLRAFFAPFGSMGALAIMADGARLARAHAYREPGGLRVSVRVWDEATGELAGSQLAVVPALSALALSPDGAHLACGSRTGTLAVWDTATGDQLATVEHGPQTVEEVAVSLGGTLVAARDGLGALAWEPATGSVLRVHAADKPDPGGRPRVVTRAHWRATVAVVPDGTLVVAADKGGTVHTWDVATRTTRPVRSNRALEWSGDPLAVAPDGTWLATASADGLVRTWDTGTGRQRAVLAGHAAQVTAAAVAPDGTWLATGDNRGLVRTWDTSPGAGSPEAGRDDLAATTVTFAPDGTWLATGDQDGRVRTWDTATGQQRLLLAGERLRTGVQRLPRISVVAEVGRIHAVAIAPDGTWLAAGSESGHVRICDTATGKRRIVLGGGLDKMTAVAIAPDGTWLATASADGLVRIWNAATGKLRTVLDNRLDIVTAVAIAPDGTWLAATSDNGHVRIRDAATGELISTFISIAAATPTAVAIAPDGTWLATVHQSSVRIWDTRTGSIRTTLADRGAQVTSAAIAPDSARLATVSADGTLQVWDPDGGSPVAAMRADSPLEDCAWSPSGHLLAAVGRSGVYLYAVNWR
jgi:WD40 repeat protein